MRGRAGSAVVASGPVLLSLSLSLSFRETSIRAFHFGRRAAAIHRASYYRSHHHRHGAWLPRIGRYYAR